jgi:molecular chaperone IbpA
MGYTERPGRVQRRSLNDRAAAFEPSIFAAAAASSPLRRAGASPDSESTRALLRVARRRRRQNGARADMSLQKEDVIMLNYDFSPFYRSTIGFDRLLSLLDKNAGLESSAPAYPPYNIERTGENAYRITLAVAGFDESELAVETRENTLTVRGAKDAQQKNGGEKPDMLYQGIAARAFERRFHLADHVSATRASCENGLLHIDLVREVPEAQKPRTIAIEPVGKTIDAAPAAKQAA